MPLFVDELVVAVPGTRIGTGVVDMVVGMDASSEDSIGVFESEAQGTGYRSISQMPLSADGGLLSCLPQCRGKGRVGERCVGVGLAFCQTGRAAPCHQSHAGRIAHQVDVVLLHPDSGVSHPIQIEGLYL